MNIYTIYQYLNFEQLMPPQVQDVKISHDNCSFTIQGMPPIHLAISERIPFSHVKMEAKDGKLPLA